MTIMNETWMLMAWIQLFLLGEGSRRSTITKHVEAFVDARAFAAAAGWSLSDFVAALMAYVEVGVPKQAPPTLTSWMALLTKCFHLVLDMNPEMRNRQRSDRQTAQAAALIADWLISVAARNPDRCFALILKGHARIFVKYCRLCGKKGTLISLPAGQISWKATEEANANGNSDVSFPEWILRQSRALEAEIADLEGRHDLVIPKPYRTEGANVRPSPQHSGEPKHPKT